MHPLPQQVCTWEPLLRHQDVDQLRLQRACMDVIAQRGCIWCIQRGGQALHDGQAHPATARHQAVQLD